MLKWVCAHADWCRDKAGAPGSKLPMAPAWGARAHPPSSSQVPKTQCISGQLQDQGLSTEASGAQHRDRRPHPGLGPRWGCPPTDPTCTREVSDPTCAAHHSPPSSAPTGQKHSECSLCSWGQLIERGVRSRGAWAGWQGIQPQHQLRPHTSCDLGCPFPSLSPSFFMSWLR